MKKILMVLLSLYSLNIMAQEEVQVSYYNEKGEETKKKLAHYKRVVITNGKNFEFTESWMDGALKKTGFASQYEPRLRQFGKEVTYYRNGKIKQEQVVKGGNSIGEIKSYYENGSLKEWGRFLKPTPIGRLDAFDYPNYITLQIADSLGKTFLDEQNSGEFDITYANGDKWEGKYLSGLKHGSIKEYQHATMDTYVEEYERGIFIRGTYIDENQKATSYTKKEIFPEYKGGIENLYSFIADNIKYPVQMKKNNIQGRVIVHFVIDRDGNLKNFKILKGIDGGEQLEQEAIRVLMMSPKWNPGIQRGKTVKVSYSVPVMFALK